jgi:hypothetical protein
MKKQFIKSNAMIVSTNSIDTLTLGNPNPDFYHDMFFVTAHPGVNVEDILKEVQQIEDDMELNIFRLGLGDSQILTTTLTEYPDVVVALTYAGFVNIAIGLSTTELKRKKYAMLAEDLIRSRDTERK